MQVIESKKTGGREELSCRQQSLAWPTLGYSHRGVSETLQPSHLEIGHE